MRTRGTDGIVQHHTQLADYVHFGEEEMMHSHLLFAEEPASYDQAKGEQGWRDSMDEEMASIEANHTWRLCDLPPGHHAIGLKWVYKLK